MTERKQSASLKEWAQAFAGPWAVGPLEIQGYPGGAQSRLSPAWAFFSRLMFIPVVLGLSSAGLIGLLYGEDLSQVDRTSFVIYGVIALIWLVGWTHFHARKRSRRVAIQWLWTAAFIALFTFPIGLYLVVMPFSLLWALLACTLTAWVVAAPAAAWMLQPAKPDA